MIYFKLIDLLLVLFATQIVKIYFDALMTPKKHPTKYHWISWGIYIAFQLAIMYFNANYPVIIIIINILITTFICTSSYVTTFGNGLLLSSILYALWMIIEVVTNICLTVLETTTLSNAFVLGVIISKVCMYILVQSIYHFKDRTPSAGLNFYNCIQLLFIPCASIYIIHNTFQLTTESQKDIFFLITTFFMLIINLLTFNIYKKLNEQAQADKTLSLYKQQLSLCTTQANEREAAYQQTKQLRHDLSEHLIALQSLLQSKKYEEANQKVCELLNQNQLYRNEISHSGNIVIDSLINYKYNALASQNITLDCSITIPPQLPFDESDFCIILGNLLDNAIEATLSLPPDNRVIKVILKVQKGIFVIMITNPYINSIITSTNQKFLTTKADKTNHGIGLSSVQYAIDKYNGILDLEYDSNKFIATVWLYMD